MGHKQNENADPLAPRRPDWEQWKSAKTAKLWQAIALACDLDPQSNFGFFEMVGKFNTRDLALQYPEFADLLEWARKDLGPNGQLKAISPCIGNLENSEVQLSSFSAWLKAAKHRPPEEFPWIPDEMPSSNLSWPWGDYETDLLNKIALAVEHFWKDFDTDSTKSIPKKMEVTDWLVKHGVKSNNIAEAIATIIRPDGLSTRPKRK